MASLSMKAGMFVQSNMFRQFQSIWPTFFPLSSVQYPSKKVPMNPIYPKPPTMMQLMKTRVQLINRSLILFSGFLALRIIGVLQVCKKQPAHRIPAIGEKLELNKTKVLGVSGLAQSVARASAALPIQYSVLVKPNTPTDVMKISNVMIKNAPKLPILIKMPISFLLLMMIPTTKRINAV